MQPAQQDRDVGVVELVEHQSLAWSAVRMRPAAAPGVDRPGSPGSSGRTMVLIFSSFALQEGERAAGSIDQRVSTSIITKLPSICRRRAGRCTRIARCPYHLGALLELACTFFVHTARCRPHIFDDEGEEPSMIMPSIVRRIGMPIAADGTASPAAPRRAAPRAHAGHDRARRSTPIADRGSGPLHLASAQHQGRNLDLLLAQAPFDQADHCCACCAFEGFDHHVAAPVQPLSGSPSARSCGPDFFAGSTIFRLVARPVP